MAHIARMAVEESLSVLSAARLGAQLRAQNIGVELAEKGTTVQYPAVYVYCEGLTNSLREKFRKFSGKAFLVAEVRVSKDRDEEILRELESYADAVAEALDGRRGGWGDEMFYAGGYKVEFGPVKRGGRNFVQTARISWELDVSVE